MTEDYIPTEYKDHQDPSPWFRTGVLVGRHLVDKYRHKPEILEKYLEAALYAQTEGDHPLFPPSLGRTKDNPYGLGEEGLAMVEAVIAQHLGRPIHEPDLFEEIKRLDEEYSTVTTAMSKRRMSPTMTAEVINGSVRALLDALCQRCEHLSKPTLAVAVAKLKWTQAYGQYGTRTNAFDPDGEPLRFSNTIDSWLHALDFRNAGVGNWNYFNRNAESKGAPSAVIILGNPKYVKGNTDAKKFYRDVKGFLEKQGYAVSFDEGKPLTSPDPADLWVGHSRGADRLKYAPPGTLTVALGVPGGVSHPKDNSLALKGPPPPDYTPNRYHFAFTSEMRSALKMKKTAKHDPSRNEYQRKYQKNRYHDRKKQAIKMLGGKCTVCGTTRSLELDHKNPDKKSFNVTKLWSVPEEEFKKEVRKCKLLCSKHHRERTSKQRENGDVKSIPGKTQYDSKGRKTKSRKNKTAGR